MNQSEPRLHDFVVAAQQTKRVEHGRYGSVLDVNADRFVVGWAPVQLTHMTLPAVVESFALTEWEGALRLVGREMNAEREAFEAGFLAGMDREIAHVEQWNLQHEPAEPPSETQAAILRGMGNCRDHWLDHAEVAWCKAKEPA